MLHWSERHCKPEHLHHIFEPGISSEERHPNPMRIVYQERLNKFSCLIYRGRKTIKIIGFSIMDQIFFYPMKILNFSMVYIFWSVSWSSWFRGYDLFDPNLIINDLLSQLLVDEIINETYTFLTFCSQKLYITIIIISPREILMIRGDRNRVFLLKRISTVEIQH